MESVSIRRGADDEIRVAFTPNDVVIKGNCLGSLLVDFAGQRIPKLVQAKSPGRLANSAVPSIRELLVTKIEPKPGLLICSHRDHDWERRRIRIFRFQIRSLHHRCGMIFLWV